jgi:NADP-dependent 3-hydroxy acid dehydrogenase YdfG
MTPFTDQIAVITGASSGIGRAIALGLAEGGAAVCLLGRRIETLKEVYEGARALNSRAFCYRMDLTVIEEVKETAVRIARDVEAIDILVHSAGFISSGPVETASLEDLDKHYLTNVRGPYALTQALLAMLRRRQGQIVFINSSAGLSARGKSAQYAASKHALKAIADSLREEINAEGIRVLSVFPGRTATPMQAALYEAEGRAYDPRILMQPADAAQVVLHALRLPRTAEVTDIQLRPLIKSY